jgi:NTF2 fold immunity protein
MHASKFAALFVGATFAIAGHAHADVILDSVECTVARIAERQIAQKYPNFDSVRFPPIVRNKGTTWEVEYQLPITMIGGTPVITIDKASLKVLRPDHTQ